MNDRELRHLRARLQEYLRARPPSRCELCRALGVSWDFLSRHLGCEVKFLGALKPRARTQDLEEDDV